MAFRKYPPANQIASPTELRELYNDAVGEINNYKKMASAANYTTRALAKDKEKFKKEAKTASKQLVQLTKKQKAAEEAEAKEVALFAQIPFIDKMDDSLN